MRAPLSISKTIAEDVARREGIAPRLAQAEGAGDIAALRACEGRDERRVALGVEEEGIVARAGEELQPGGFEHGLHRPEHGARAGDVLELQAAFAAAVAAKCARICTSATLS